MKPPFKFIWESDTKKMEKNINSLITTLFKDKGEKETPRREISIKSVIAGRS